MTALLYIYPKEAVSWLFAAVAAATSGAGASAIPKCSFANCSAPVCPPVREQTSFPSLHALIINALCRVLLCASVISHNSQLSAWCRDMKSVACCLLCAVAFKCHDEIR